MRILHIFFSFPVGGAESMLVDIMNKQVVENEVGLCVINNYYSTELLTKLDKKIEIILMNRVEGRKSLWDLVKLNRLVWHFKPQIIHSHQSKVILFLPVSKLMKRVCTIHDNNLPNKGIKQYDALYVISRSVRDELLGKGLTNVTLIYNGIDLGTIAVADGNATPAEPFKLVQVARLEHTKKGQHILIEALSILKKKYGSPRISLDFIGEGSSLNHLSELVARYGLEKEVRFLGLQSRSYIYSHLRNYDLLVHPSLYEGFGLTVAEAMAASIPVLVSDSGGPAEVINQGEAGFMFQLGDPADLADKLYWLICHPNERKEMAVKGREYVVNHFSIDNTVSQYAAAYEKILSR